MPQAVDVYNKFLIGSADGGIVFLAPLPRRLSRYESLLLAAYIVAMTVPLDGEPCFDEVLKAVINA